MTIFPLGSSACIKLAVRDRSAAASSKNGHPQQQMLRELQQQLREVMRQMQRVRDSNTAAALKAQQLQQLNNQAMSLQGQIQSVLAEQLRQLQAQA